MELLNENNNNRYNNDYFIIEELEEENKYTSNFTNSKKTIDNNPLNKLNKEMFPNLNDIFKNKKILKKNSLNLNNLSSNEKIIPAKQNNLILKSKVLNYFSKKLDCILKDKNKTTKLNKIINKINLLNKKKKSLNLKKTNNSMVNTKLTKKKLNKKISIFKLEVDKIIIKNPDNWKRKTSMNSCNLKSKNYKKNSIFINKNCFRKKKNSSVFLDLQQKYLNYKKLVNSNNTNNKTIFLKKPKKIKNLIKKEIRETLKIIKLS